MSTLELIIIGGEWGIILQQVEYYDVK